MIYIVYLLTPRCILIYHMPIGYKEHIHVLHKLCYVL